MTTPDAPSAARHAAALLGYAVVAIVFTWPLALHLSTTLTGSPGGDTGNYVWNQWIFQHELLEHGSSPYFTAHLFGGTRPANLSLHNYTTFQNLLALPLVGTLGVVATFNVVYLLMTILSAYSMFLLGLDLTRSPGAAWLGGLLFAWSPFMVTRGMAHFSLVAAAPLPLLLLVLHRAAGRERLRHAFAVGTLVWWSASTDVYYAVYAVLLVIGFTAANVLSLHRRRQPIGRTIQWALHVLIAIAAGIVALITISGGGEVRLFGRGVHARSLYTPVLALTVLVLIRAAWHVRASFLPMSRADVWRVIRLATVSGIVAAALLSPVLYAFGARIVSGDFNPPTIYWRSSPSGVDLAWLFLPNPNHALTPAWVREWLGAPPADYVENVASIPWMALIVIGAALQRGWRPTRRDLALLIAFVLLALGPFLIVGGVNTHVPGPWALLRYVPVVGLARTPARFMAVVMLMTSILFTSGLAWTARRSPARGRVTMLVVGLLLAFELAPLPRTLYAATVPTIYQHVAASPADSVVLQLPFGVRDGTSSVGNFSALTEFFQTAHGRTIMGGYLSRLSNRRRHDVRSDPVLNALAVLSEGGHISQSERRAFQDAAPRFIRDRRIRFVVIDGSQTPDDLRHAATDALQLQFVASDGAYELWIPQQAP